MSLNPATTAALAEWNASVATLAPVLTGEDTTTTLDSIRKDYNAMQAKNPAPEGILFAEVDMGGVRGVEVTPDEVLDDRVMLYIHGGAYILGSPDGYHSVGGHFAKTLRARVYMPDYRLAPEHPFPTPIDDVVTAYAWLLQQGHSPEDIVFSGDSAGGAMTVSAMILARRRGLPLPAAGVALSPWANLEHTGATMTSREGLDPLGTKAGLDLMARTFLAEERPGNPEASPVFADVRGLPPIMIMIGEAELMLSDAIRLASHLAENRVRVTLEVWPGMVHVWPMFAAILPEGLAAYENAGRFLLQALESDSSDRGIG